MDKMHDDILEACTNEHRDYLCIGNLGLVLRLNNGSRMNREVHVRFCEGLAGKLRWSTLRNIYVKSERAGKRVMESITRFITCKLKLKVNQEKSVVDKPSSRKFLGYSFTKEEQPRIKISPKSLERFKDRIREITNRNRGVSVVQVVKELNDYVRGWMGYYRYCQTTSVLENLDSWIRRRMRCFIWNGWKTFANRAKELKKRGVGERLTNTTSVASGSWAVSKSKGMQIALPNIYFKSIGVLRLISFVKV